MENNNQLQKVISTTSLHFLEVMKHQSVDERFTILEELGEWIYTSIDIDEILFVPNWETINES